MLPLVTIMIPTYNQSQYLNEAIQSALNQSYTNKQIIVLDDCSTDKTEEIMSKYAEKEEVEYVRHSTNIGRVKNYRKGLYEYAQGEWVINLDGDDYFTDKFFIEKAVNVSSVDSDIVLISADRIEVSMDLSHQHEKVKVSEERVTIHDGNEIFLGIPKKKYQLYHLTSLYKGKYAKAIDFYNADIISSDYESLYRLVLGHKVALIHWPVAAWRAHAENESRTSEIGKLIANFSIFKSVISYAKENEYLNRYNRLKWYVDISSKKYYTNILSMLKNGRKKDVIKLTKFVICNFPLSFLKTVFNPKLYIKILFSIK